MLFALRQPAVLLGLALGFAVGCLLRTASTRLILRAPAGRLGAGPRLVGRRSPLAGLFRPGSWLDPFGTVAALLSGAGWSVREPAPRRPGRLWAVAVGVVVVHGLLTAAGIAGYLAAGGSRDAFPFVDTVSILHGTQSPVSVAQQVALGFAVENLACGLLSIVPIPPLETGVAAWSTLPRTAGAHRLAYRLLEEQWGVAALLVLMLLPLAGEQPLLLALVGAVANPILHAI
jgi:hypothetical protein